MARWPRQIRLLIWKNFILQMRRPIGTTIEILLPVAFASLLVVARFTIMTDPKTNCFSTFKSQTSADYVTDRYYPTRTAKMLAFFPNTTWTNEIMQSASKKLKLIPVSRDSSGNPFTSEDSIARKVAADTSTYYAAIIFKDASSPKLPKRIEYKIRLSTYYYGDYGMAWNTGRTYPQYISPGPRGIYSPDYADKFLPLQYVIDKTIIEKQTGQYNLTVATNLDQFPYPAWKEDGFTKTVQYMMPMLFTLAFIYTAITMIKELVAEKQSQLKESMKMMGLANWVHWLSWFIKNLIFLTISCVFLTILLKAAKILEYSNWSLVFVFFLCYSVSMIFFAFAMSVFFSNAILSMLFSAVIWLGTYAPYAALAAPGTTKYDEMTLVQKAALCLLPNSCLGIGVQVITKMESAQIGAQWSDFYRPPTIDDNMSLASVFLMMFVQSFMWWIITWYVESVFPGKFGVAKPLYFFLTPSYWCGSTCGKSCDDNEVYNNEAMLMSSRSSSPNIEKAPSDLEVGVNIDNLRKIFSSSTGKKVAVDGLSLKIYKGQITALLGHNGAGKTTTMSMLTGLYQPTNGKATINGRSILTEMDQIRDSLGLCPQHNVLFDRLSVKEHLQLFIALKGQTGKSAEIKINQMIEDIQLTDKKNAKSATLSGGMKRKLSCAIALIGDPDVVFLDEPTSGMDPYARRATWDLLQKYTANKTVVLTTHFMDEADYLGDRIAIMADGALRCCGSSLFLKKRFGVGYHMNLVKAPSFKQAEVQRAIEQHIPRAKMVSNVGAEMRYILEHESSKKFKGLFELLEDRKENLGIGSFGVSITTLEEVFLKVGELGEESSKDEPESEKIDSAVKEHENTISLIVKREDLLTGAALKMSQFRAMFVKRFLNSKRQKRAVVTQIILPALMILCGLLLAKISSSESDEPPLVMDFSMLSKPDERTNAYLADYRPRVNATEKARWKKFAERYYKTVRVNLWDVAKDSLAIKTANLNNSVTVDERKYTLTPNNMAACCKYKTLVLNEKCKSQVGTTFSFESLCGNDKSFGYAHCKKCIKSTYYQPYGCPVGVSKTNLHDPYTFYNAYVLKKSNNRRFFRKYVAGITLKNSTTTGKTDRPAITAWFSAQALHNVPSTFSAVNNIILAVLKNDASYSIQVTNHPLPKTTKQKAKDFNSGSSNFVLCIFVTMAACFIAASFVPYLVIERSTKAKHVQFVSGVDSRIYWLASFCWDYINYLFPATFIVILFASFQLDSYQGANLGALCVIIFLNGFAVLPFVYCLSFVFKSGLVAYAVVALVGMLISMGLVFLNFFLRMPGSAYINTGNTLHRIFLLLPTYALPSSIIDIGSYYTLYRSCQKTRSKQVCANLPSSPISWEYPGVGMACFYLVLESFLYLILVILIEERFFLKCKSKEIVARTPDEREDPDVVQERGRVDAMTEKEIDNEAIVIQDLSKVFRKNNIKAVDGLSVGIPRKECFGLLGVNGAGKTTTFGMLTGELGITGGTAWLNGFNIQTQLREVQQRIGYCPQFDALLDKLTGREMLEMFAKLRGIPPHKTADVVNSVIFQLNLGEWADKMCGNYSGGNKRKLSTALALVGDPPIVFLDEPTSGMDPASRRFLWNTLNSLLDDRRSIVLTSHSMEECEALCTRLVIMVNGQFKCLGSIQHLKSRFGQGYTLMIKIGKKEKMDRRTSSIRRTGSASNRSYKQSLSSDTDPIMPDVDIVIPTNSNEAAAKDSVDLLESTKKVKDFIAQSMPGSWLLDDRLGMLHYQILNQSLTWSYMFGALEENAEQFDIIDYSISQTTLEQVFINFAKYQRPEEPKRKRCVCNCTC